jgi:hypothetical protein
MENESSKFRLSTHESVVPGYFQVCIQDGEDYHIQFFGAIGCLADELFAGSIVNEILQEHSDVCLIVNEMDFDFNIDLIDPNDLLGLQKYGE